MSAICILAPVVVAAWPALSAAATAAATSLGYQLVSEARDAVAATKVAPRAHSVEVAVARSEVVTDQLSRNQRLTVVRDGVTVTFSRDTRGRASLCVTGTGCSDEALRQMGEELSRAMVQQYVYQKLTDEMRTRGFMVVEEERTAENAIHLKVRRWED